MVIRFAQVPERTSTESFVILSIGNSKSSHLGAQGSFKEHVDHLERGEAVIVL